MDWTFIGHAVNAIPPFDVAANDKLRFVSLFFAVVVAANWLDNAERDRAAPFVAIGAAITAASMYVYRKQVAVMRPSDLAGVAAVVAFILLYRLFRSRPRLPAIVAAALTAVELFTFNAGFNRFVSTRYFRPELPIIPALRDHAPCEPFRIAGFAWVFSPNAAVQYGLEDVRGSDPMSLARYTRVLGRAGEIAKGDEVVRVLRPEHPLLDFLGVRFLLAEPETSFGRKWRPIYRGKDGALFENTQARKRFFADGAVVEVRQTSTSSFVVAIRTPRPVTVVSSEPAASGWEARVAGRKVPVRVV